VKGVGDEQAVPRYGIIGGLTLDNVITADGRCFIAKPGGNTLWSALGAALWGGSVGIVSRAGTDYPDATLTGLAMRGVDVSGITRYRAPHRLRISYQHEANGGRRQPVPEAVLDRLPEAQRLAFVDTTIDSVARKGADPSFHDIPLHWLSAVVAWHVPLLPLATHRALVTELAAQTMAQVTSDCPNRIELSNLVEDMRPSLAGIDVFLPSTSDLDVVHPDLAPVEVLDALLDAGARTIVLKCGAEGSLVADSLGRRYRIPAFPVRVVDPTGAGDAFCGGFIVGLVTTGDPALAAVYGAVSASFAIETADPLDLAAVGMVAVEERARFVRRHLAHL